MGLSQGTLRSWKQMMTALPGTDPRGDPNIISKIHVWKKQYASSSLMLMHGSGNGFQSDTNMVEATEEKWEAQIKVNVLIVPE